MENLNFEIEPLPINRMLRLDMKKKFGSIPLGHGIEDLIRDFTLKSSISIGVVNDGIDLLGVSIQVDLWALHIPILESDVIHCGIVNII